MESQQATKTNYLAIGISVLSALIIVLEALTWGAIVFPAIGNAIGMVVETSVMQSGYLLPLPLGLLDIIVGIIALPKRSSIKKKFAVIGVTIGLLGILTGLFWWLLLSSFFGQVY